MSIGGLSAPRSGMQTLHEDNMTISDTTTTNESKYIPAATRPVDMAAIERRMTFVMDELRDIGSSAYRIAAATEASGPDLVNWKHGRFSAFLQQAADAVWTARCTVGLVPSNEPESP
jgi:hypothetical protein